MRHPCLPHLSVCFLEGETKDGQYFVPLESVKRSWINRQFIDQSELIQKIGLNWYHLIVKDGISRCFLLKDDIKQKLKLVLWSLIIIGWQHSQINSTPPCHFWAQLVGWNWRLGKCKISNQRSVRYLSVCVSTLGPPEKLLLRRIPLNSDSRPLQDGQIRLLPDPLQSDNPSLADIHTFQNFEKSLSQNSLSIHPLRHSPVNMDLATATIHQNDEIWALEGQQISMECIASPSLPVTQLMWALSPVVGSDEDISLQPSFSFEDFSEGHHRLRFEQKYPKWRFILDPREENNLGFKVEYKESADTASGLLV